jgi:hypothetical protein
MTILPEEADSVLIVDFYAPLASSIPRQALEAIARRNGKLMKITHAVDLREFPVGGRPNGHGASGTRRLAPQAIEHILGSTASEGAYHVSYYNG